MSGIWNFEGSRVYGSYLNGDIDVSGIVTKSRVAYGGKVEHWITLDRGFSLYGGRVRREAGETVIIEHASITRITGGNSIAA